MVWGAVALAGLYTLLAVTVGVTFYRPIAIDNDPLTNSVAVASVFTNRLTLADGRVVVMLGYPSDVLKEQIRDSGERIEHNTALWRAASDPRLDEFDWKCGAMVALPRCSAIRGSGLSREWLCLTRRPYDIRVHAHLIRLLMLIRG